MKIKSLTLITLLLLLVSASLTTNITPWVKADSPIDIGTNPATVPVGEQPMGIVYDSAKGEIFVANDADKSVSVISDSNNTVIATIPVGDYLQCMVYDSGEGEIYVASGWSNFVYVISDTTNTVIANISVGGIPGRMAYDPSKGVIFVAKYFSNSISVISDTSHTVVATIPMVGPGDFAYDSARGLIYATTNDNSVAIISDNTNTVIENITLSTDAGAITYDSGKDNIFVTTQENTVLVISGGTHSVIATIPVGEGPIKAVYDSGRGEIYIANYGGYNLEPCSISIISDDTNTVTATIPVESSPYDLAYDSAKNEIFVPIAYRDKVLILHDFGPAVTVSPSSAAIDVGQSQTFNATAFGGIGTLSLQWYLNGSPVPGQTSTNYTYTAAFSGSPVIFCQATDQASTPVIARSEAPSFTVNPALISPTVTANPSTVVKGQTSTLSSPILTGTPYYTIKWFVKAPNSSVYSNAGSTYTYDTTYLYFDTTTVATGVWHFMLQVKDRTGVAVNSTEAIVTVNTVPTVIVTPDSVGMDVGQSKTFTATPAGGTGNYTTYQWYVDERLQTGQNASTFTYTPTSPSNGPVFIEVTVTDSSGATSIFWADSTIALATVFSGLIAPILTSTSSTINQGDATTLTSSTITTGWQPYNYQWLWKTPEATSYTPITGAHSSTYNFATSSSTETGTYTFQLQVTDQAEAVVMSTTTDVVVSAVSSSTPTPTNTQSSSSTTTSTVKPTQTPQATPVTPEFPVITILPLLFVVLTIEAIILHRKEIRKPLKTDTCLI